MIENALLDLAGLLGVGIWYRLPVKVWRMFLAVVFGVTGGTLCFLCVSSFPLYCILLFLLVNPLMLQISFGWLTMDKLGRFYLAHVICTVLFGGLFLSLEQLIPMESVILVLTVSIMLFIPLLYVWRMRTDKDGGMTEVSVLANNRVIRAVALKDTGNSLRDPLTGMAVCIVPSSWEKQLALTTEKRRTIVYQTVAGEERIPVYPVTKFLISENGRYREQKKIVLGFAKESLFYGKEYEMILHKDFC